MTLRVATFNVENLMHRFDFSGYRNETRRDRALRMVDVRDESHFKQLEEARTIALTDDKMQLTALAIAQTRADIICLQEVENLEALGAFEYGYLFKMVGHGYRNKYLLEGNDGRGIDVAVMTRDETADGEAIELVDMRSHAHVTYGDLGLMTPALKDIGERPHERVFRRDCLELDFKVGGRWLTVFVVHFKSMGPGRGDKDGRTATSPIRLAEAAATRRIIEDKFDGATVDKRWLICGDFNDYRSRLVVRDGGEGGHEFQQVDEAECGFDPLLRDGFSVDLTERREPIDRWTLYHSRGPDERHLCQLDYILASPAVAVSNANAVPDIIRNGQPWRTPFPPGQEVDRYPRIGWDRPKASDHCPVAVTLNLA